MTSTSPGGAAGAADQDQHHDGANEINDSGNVDRDDARGDPDPPTANADVNITTSSSNEDQNSANPDTGSLQKAPTKNTPNKTTPNKNTPNKNGATKEIESKPLNPQKAILFINLHIFFLSLNFLTAKFIYTRNPSVQPFQLLFVRGIISIFWSILWVNKKLKYVIWDSVPRRLFPSLAKRSLQGSCLILIQFTIVKYLDLVIVGLAQNVTPLVTVLMAYLMTGEKMKKIDVWMLAFTFIGVTLVTVGFSSSDSDGHDGAFTGNSSNSAVSTGAGVDEHLQILDAGTTKSLKSSSRSNSKSQTVELKLESPSSPGQNPSRPDSIPLFAICGACAVPFLQSYGNILMSTMRDLHENTVSLYMNPAVTFFMYAYLVYLSVAEQNNSGIFEGDNINNSGFNPGIASEYEGGAATMESVLVEGSIRVGPGVGSVETSGGSESNADSINADTEIEGHHLQYDLLHHLLPFSQLQPLNSLPLFDWILITLFSGNVLVVQTLKFIALQNEEPAKLGSWQYLNCVYQLAFDLTIFNASFKTIQWTGIGIMFAGYGLKMGQVIRNLGQIFLIKRSKKKRGFEKLDGSNGINSSSDNGNGSETLTSDINNINHPTAMRNQSAVGMGTEMADKSGTSRGRGINGSGGINRDPGGINRGPGGIKRDSGMAAQTIGTSHLEPEIEPDLIEPDLVEPDLTNHPRE